MTVFDGGPAHRAGLQPGDWIDAIDGRDLAGARANDLAGLLRGPAGSLVRLRVRREPSGEGRLVEIARERLTSSSVHAVAMVEDGTGYLRLGAFNERTDTDTAEALERLARNGMRRLVVDLRDNGGGLLDQALMIAMHFLPRDALIASTLGRARATTDFRVPGIGAFTELGLSVLVNGSTAAGAEILAGALQDHRRAVVVGTPTFGRASIQSMHRLRGGGYLSLTTARWTRPVSGSVHPGGIRPDVAIDAPLCEAVRGGQGDVQLQRAVQALRDSR